MHFGSPDKDPAVRLAVIEDAGRQRIPFTTGILVGIGETVRDRAESLVAIREAHERHVVDGQGHVQEVIVQNFRAKPRTAMQGAPDAELLEYVAAVAVARLVMGPRMRIQVPPNRRTPPSSACSCAPAPTTGAACRPSPPITSTPSAPGRTCRTSPA